MKVTFETYTLVFKGYNEEYNIPIYEHKDVRKVEGEVIDTIVFNWPDSIGKMCLEPCFVVALDDLSFTYVPIKDCKKVENI